MTTVKEKTTTKTNDFIEQAEKQVNDWFDYFNRLQENVRDAGDDVDQMYHERIADLKSKLDEVEERFDDLRSSDQDNWEQQRYRFQQASRNYQQSYATLINDMKEDESISTGWLEDFTNQTTGLVDWLEEKIEEIPQSEGGKEVYLEEEVESIPQSEGGKEVYTR